MGGFDWVSTRSKCSLEQSFVLLSEIVDSDVKAANALKRRDVEFKINSEPTKKLVVIRDQDLGGMHGFINVVFELRADKITVFIRKGGEFLPVPMFSFVPSLNEEGECLYRIEGEEAQLKLWQVSRKALEDLFFGF